MRIADLSFLAVEDHDFQRGVLLRILAGLGAKGAIGAPDGRAALDVLMAHDAGVDIVISDLDMPGMDGMEFMRHIGEAHLPVSVILASALEGSLLASVEAMARIYGVRILGTIEKPVTAAKLEPLIALHASEPAKAGPAEGGRFAFTLDDVVRGLDNDEFEPFFQPKVELGSGRIRGAEALARWRHPQHGVIAPAEFIGLMEYHGLIDALTWIMLRKAAAFCSAWRAASGQDVSISVNLSVKSLADVQLAGRIVEVVRGANLEPQHMIFEVTESATTTSAGAALENLSRLRMKGFGLSIDDYGTGYASIHHVTRIAFTELKIDQSFVVNAAEQKAARVVLESSLDMARKLHIISVAEGVETQQGWDLLRRLGCSWAQGDFIAAPMEAAVFLKWAQARTRMDELATQDETLPAPMDQASAGADDPIARLRHALKSDEFLLFCQPVLSLDGQEGYAIGEVLVRMREEEATSLPPGEFLHLFEHYELMPQLDRWVVRSVIQHLSQGSRIPRICMNISRQTLNDAAFPQFVADELIRKGVGASGLLFGIEESDVLALPEAAARFASAVRSAGSCVLVDGFGRTAASLMVLKNLRVDFVKLSGHVVRGLLTSDVARRQVEIILRLGSSIGFGVIAADVEDQDVLATLKALGVGYAQGFGIQAPRAISELLGKRGIPRPGRGKVAATLSREMQP